MCGARNPIGPNVKGGFTEFPLNEPVGLASEEVMSIRRDHVASAMSTERVS